MPKSPQLSLALRNAPFSEPSEQVRTLEAAGGVAPFERALEDRGLGPLAATGIEILQINVGKLCNQTCRHCHVDAGPDRREIMTRETMEACIEAVRRTDIGVVDITGGAPEMNPEFRWLVERVRALDRHVIDRCNLTVLFLKGQEDLAEFLAAHEVEIIASLPYYLERETDSQRGEGVFGRSIDALRTLNGLGYGREGTGLRLNLVYNPVGAYLPPSQSSVESDYKRELERRHGVFFNSLYTITNMPISRFLEYLIASGNYERYMERLVDAFNPGAAESVMCRTTLSVGWDGRLFDCDFNQMLDLECGTGLPRHIRDFDPVTLAGRRIVTGRHCYGCTAGGGSSCGGETA